jgi:3-oxoacyl-[acyl-carrier protein] reductase
MRRMLYLKLRLLKEMYEKFKKIRNKEFLKNPDRGSLRLKDSVAIVTGGGRGIGKTIALALAKEGAKIVICARTIREIYNTAKEIRSLGREVLAVKSDVRSSDDVRNFIKKAISKFGRVDILINNAGIGLYKPLMKTSEKNWEDVIDTNLKGTFLCCREVLPIMVKQRKGIIVNISSVAGKHGFANMSAYCASKFGVIGLTESLAKEVNKFGIKVYAVCPDRVDTEIKREYVAKKVLSLCLPTCKIKNGSSIDVYWK